MNRTETEQEFSRILDVLIRQNDISVIEGLIPFEAKEAFVTDWHEQDET